jgi:hypothetical protein
MKVGLRFNKAVYFRIEYDNNEYSRIESKLLVIGLNKSITHNLFGKNIESEYYRNSDNVVLKNALSNSLSEISYRHGISFRDDINNEILNREHYNLAIFRVIPNDKGIIEIPIGKFLTIAELKKFSDILKDILELILNIPNESDEVEIRIEDNKNG